MQKDKNSPVSKTFLRMVFALCWSLYFLLKMVHIIRLSRLWKSTFISTEGINSQSLTWTEESKIISFAANILWHWQWCRITHSFVESLLNSFYASLSDRHSRISATLTVENPLQNKLGSRWDKFFLRRKKNRDT